MSQLNYPHFHNVIKDRWRCFSQKKKEAKRTLILRAKLSYEEQQITFIEKGN